MRLGIILSGQGDQSPAMFAPLAGQSEAEPILSACAALIGREPRALSLAEMQVNALAQPVICALQLALWFCLRQHLPPVRVFAGYSLGELSCYGCSGALEPAQLLALARDRAQAMDRAHAGPAGMMAVRGLTLASCAPICAPHGVEIAIVNDHDRLILGGAAESLDSVEPFLLEQGGKVTRLAIQIPSHTGLLRQAVAPMAASLAASRLTDPRQPILAGIDGRPVRQRERATEFLSRQLAERLNWAACMDGLQEMGCDTVLELGPGGGLTAMLRERHPAIKARSLQDFQSLAGVIAWIQGQLG